MIPLDDDIWIRQGGSTRVKIARTLPVDNSCTPSLECYGNGDCVSNQGQLWDDSCRSTLRFVRPLEEHTQSCALYHMHTSLLKPLHIQTSPSAATLEPNDPFSSPHLQSAPPRFYNHPHYLQALRIMSPDYKYLSPFTALSTS